jgi:5,6-dimethylbenzimidazole synthase
MVEGVVTGAFNDAERAAVYRVIAERRDVRRGFLATPLPQDLLERLLSAAHSAPSVGLMQPTRFIVVRDLTIRRSIHAAFEQSNAAASAAYEHARRAQYDDLKLEGILEAPLNLCIVCDADSSRGHKLGRRTMPETAVYSTVCAIQNFWLAARAEGVGVGWVSILEPSKLHEILAIPAHMTVVAYLCLGYVDRFGAAPELERLGWENRVSLQTVVSRNRFGEGGLS